MYHLATSHLISLVCLCFGSTGPLFAGYMLNGGHSWRLFFYVEFAFGAALFFLAFFVVEETTYHRRRPGAAMPPNDETDTAVVLADGEKPGSGVAESIITTPVINDIPPRKTFVQTLKFWGVWEKDSEFLMMIVRSFTYFVVPHVFWVITTYGLSLSQQTQSPTLFFRFRFVNHHKANQNLPQKQGSTSASAP